MGVSLEVDLPSSGRSSGRSVSSTLTSSSCSVSPADGSFTVILPKPKMTLQMGSLVQVTLVYRKTETSPSSMVWNPDCSMLLSSDSSLNLPHGLPPVQQVEVCALALQP